MGHRTILEALPFSVHFCLVPKAYVQAQPFVCAEQCPHGVIQQTQRKFVSWDPGKPRPQIPYCHSLFLTFCTFQNEIFFFLSIKLLDIRQTPLRLLIWESFINHYTLVRIWWLGYFLEHSLIVKGGYRKEEIPGESLEMILRW